MHIYANKRDKIKVMIVFILQWTLFFWVALLEYKILCPVANSHLANEIVAW